METFKITSCNENQKIITYLRKQLPLAKKKFLYRMFRKKHIILNNKRIKGDEVIKTGDEIKLYFSKETFENLKKEIDTNGFHNPLVHPFHHELDIIYEDDSLIIVNKPVNKLLLPDKKHANVAEDIERYLINKTIHYIGFKPGVCTRLDKNTSGLIVAGKNIKTLQTINYALANHFVTKLYRTIVLGDINQKFDLNGYLEKEINIKRIKILLKANKYNIHTTVRPIRTNGMYSEIEVELEGNHPHQIRAHLAAIGHPIIGDRKYGNSTVNAYFRKQYALKHQLIHAGTITFNQLDEPLKYIEGKEFYVDVPDEYANIAQKIFTNTKGI